MSRYLAEHGTDLHHRLGIHSPWWLPGPVEDRMVERLLQRSQQVLDDMAAHPDHPLRQQLDAGLVKLAEDLQTSEELRRRGEELKAELLGPTADPGLRRHRVAAISRSSCGRRPPNPARSCGPG